MNSYSLHNRRRTIALSDYPIRRCVVVLDSSTTWAAFVLIETTGGSISFVNQPPLEPPTAFLHSINHF